MSDNRPDWTAAAADMLKTWDGWFSGQHPHLKGDADKLMIAASFGATAFDRAVSHCLTADGAPMYFMDAFLRALIDPMDPALDPLRICNQAAAQGEKA